MLEGSSWKPEASISRQMLRICSEARQEAAAQKRRHISGIQLRIATATKPEEAKTRLIWSRLPDKNKQTNNKKKKQAERKLAGTYRSGSSRSPAAGRGAAAVKEPPSLPSSRL